MLDELTSMQDPTTDSDVNLEDVGPPDNPGRADDDGDIASDDCACATLNRPRRGPSHISRLLVLLLIMGLIAARRE